MHPLRRRGALASRGGGKTCLPGPRTALRPNQARSPNILNLHRLSDDGTLAHRLQAQRNVDSACKGSSSAKYSVGRQFDVIVCSVGRAAVGRGAGVAANGFGAVQRLAGRRGCRSAADRRADKPAAPAAAAAGNQLSAAEQQLPVQRPPVKQPVKQQPEIEPGHQGRQQSSGGNLASRERSAGPQCPSDSSDPAAQQQQSPDARRRDNKHAERGRSECTVATGCGKFEQPRPGRRSRPRAGLGTGPGRAGQALAQRQERRGR